MFGIFFSEHPVASYADVIECDEVVFKRFFHEMLKRGVYFAPAMYEAGFVSSTHTRDVIDRTLQEARSAFKSL